MSRKKRSPKHRTFIAVLPNGDEVRVRARGLNAASHRLTGYRVLGAIRRGLIRSMREETELHHRP